MQFFSNKITLDKKKELGDMLNRYPHETSGLTFTSLYMWRISNYFTYEIIDDFLCIAGRTNFEGFEEEPFVFPLIPLSGEFDAAKMRDAIDVIKDRFTELGKPYVMRLIPDTMIGQYEAAMPGRFLFIGDRANYDYLYRTEDLANLRGRSFHGKKNHVNKFNKELVGRYEVVPMSGALAGEALDLLDYIDAKKQVEGFEKLMLEEEAKVLRDTLPHFDELGMEGAAIRIDGRLEAYAFGGALGSNTIVEHIEKGNIDFPGIYQKINQEFCKSVQGRYEFVNREEDMGLEGLRKAKTSYKPCRMIEKSIALLADDKEAAERYGSLE